MRHLISKLLTMTTFIVGAATAASAADMPNRMATKSPAYAVPAYNWTGFYAGLNVGGGWGSSTGSNFSGVIGGGQLGYNWQTSNLVFGVETDIQASSVKGSGTATALGATFSETGKANYFGTVRGRVGFAQDRWLAYVTGGWAYSTIKIDGTATGAVTGSYSASNALNGYALGGGVEWAAWDRWTAKLEYLYISFPGFTNTYATTPAVVSTYGRLNLNVVRVGLNYRF